VKAGEVQMVRRSRGMMAGGIVMASISGLVTLTGLVLVGSGAWSEKGISWGTLLVGAGLIGGGVALAVVGGKNVPPKPEQARTELFIGPTSLTIRGQF
jgi:hypothetical protein